MTTERIPSLTLGGLALCVGAAVAFVPLLLPTGPTTALDATAALRSGSFAAGAAVVFLGGLLTALTPCVYPLIPVTVGVFGARKSEKRLQSVALTIAYVLGLSAVFTGLGIFAAKGGQAFGSLLGTPGVALGVAAFLVLLASSLFGAFELNLPQGLVTRLSRVSGSGVLGAFLMGGVSGFLAAPCTGPVLTGLLTFVATSQSVLLGGSLLFVYALGMGLPFVLIGVFAVHLPKAGVWMEWVKSALGVLLLALAFTYARDAFPAARMVSGDVARMVGRIPGTTLAAVLAAVGVAWGALHLSFLAGWGERLTKAGGVALLVAGLVLRMAALDAPAHAHAETGLAWRLMFRAPPDHLEVFESALAQARSEGRPVLIDFFADWCAACKELDRVTYVAPEVAEESRRFVAIKVDGTNEPEAIQKLYDRFGVQGLPTVAFVSSEGRVLTSPRVTGFLEPAPFLATLRQVR